MRSFLAIVNPAAGGGRCGQRSAQALDELRRAGLDIEVARTGMAGEASEVVRRAWQAGRRHFLAVGGDGTAFEIVNGLFPQALSNNDSDGPCLGFLPLGTGNSFLRDFSQAGTRHARDALLRGEPRVCDVVRLRHRDGEVHYINIMSIGFAAEVNALRQRRFRVLGELGYVAAVILQVAALRSEPLRLLVDGEADVGETVFASFSNSRFTGGKMMMAPLADTADGMVDLVRAGSLGRLRLLAAFPRIFSGTHLQLPEVSCRQVRSVRFSFDREIEVMVDGEALRMVPEALDVLPGALRVLV